MARAHLVGRTFRPAAQPARLDALLAELSKHLEEGCMRRWEVVMVTGEVVGRELPVRRHLVLLHAWYDLEPAKERHGHEMVQIPAHVVQEGVQRHHVGIPGGKDETSPSVNSRCLK